MDVLLLTVCIIAIVACLLTVFTRNIHRSLVFFTLFMVSIASLFFFLEAEYVGLVQLIASVSLIRLFISPEQLLKTGKAEKAEKAQIKRAPLIFMASVIIAGVASFAIFSTNWERSTEMPTNMVIEFNGLLTGKYALALELFAFLVLITAIFVVVRVKGVGKE